MTPLVAGIALLNACGLFAVAVAERVGSARPVKRRSTLWKSLHEGRCAETLRFLRAWVRAPLRIASVVPSGAPLARLMTREIGPHTGPVVELGPGTGPFTRALLARGVREGDLALVEFEEEFARSLSIAFPAAQTLCIDAARIDAIEIFDGRPAGAVVSGLPLLSMPERQVAAILRSTFGKLTPGGAFYQFTYGPRCPVPPHVLTSLGLEAERIGRTLANLPPATVYRIVRSAERGRREEGLGGL